MVSRLHILNIFFATLCTILAIRELSEGNSIAMYINAIAAIVNGYQSAL